MTSAVAQKLRALDLLRTRGMLRLEEFVAEGIGPETLARLVREEAVVRSARGLYQLPDTQVEAVPTPRGFSGRKPAGSVCRKRVARLLRQPGLAGLVGAGGRARRAWSAATTRLRIESAEEMTAASSELERIVVQARQIGEQSSDSID